MNATDTGRHRHDRWGWAGVAAITLAVGATWMATLNAPLAGNHFGNVAARYGLHVKNLFEHGVLGSDFGAGWLPYSSEPYAHHPPLLNVLDAIIGLIPGDGEYQLRIAPFVLALSAIPAAAALLRNLEMSWGATLLAMGAMANTGYFWIYGPVMFDIGPILAFSAAAVYLRSHAATPNAVRSIAVLGFVVGLASWPGIVFAIAATLWLAVARGPDRPTIAIATGVGLGVVASLLFMFGVNGFGALTEQADKRTTGGSYTAGEFTKVVWRFMRELLPSWYLWLLPVALVVGLIDRRTRSYVGVSGVFAVGWIVVFNNGAYVHDYWGYLILIPGLVGSAALFDGIIRLAAARIKSPVINTGVAICGVALVVAFATMALGATADEYVHDPSDAGTLIEQAELPAGQQYAWSVGFQYGRIVTYYWQLPSRGLNSSQLDLLDHDELVFVNLDNLPAWYPDDPPPQLANKLGNYALVHTEDLKALMP